MDDREPDSAEAPIDLADESFDLAAFVLVVLHSFASRRGNLHHHASLWIDLAGLEEGTERAQAKPDALRVIEAVDTEQNHLGVAESSADLAGEFAGGATGGHLFDFGEVDRDRKHADGRVMSWEFDDPVALFDPEELLCAGGEVRGAHWTLEPDQIAAE